MENIGIDARNASRDPKLIPPLDGDQAVRVLAEGRTRQGIGGRWVSMGLIRTVLNSASLEGANLRGADLSRSKLEFAILKGADLTDAVLTRADLAGADLTGARVSGAEFGGADVAGAKLRNLSGVEQAKGFDKLVNADRAWRD
jgi:uncharacterized protein YjbI with pentapeptide repeats